METLSYPHVQETLYREVLDNGLEVVILPKEGFRKTYATFSTKYGSIDNRFSVGNEAEVSVPDGIAHFLEHKMFEEPEGDIFAVFASQGAWTNAYTSFDRTVYMFSGTEQIGANVKTLLDFVQRPYLTDANVEKEKGIIEQEIDMYRDNANWRVYFGLIDALYHAHPVHIDIAGTAESIARIDKETLLRCYGTFYHPSNMLLFVVGGVDAAEMIELVRDNQAAKSFVPQGAIQRYFDEEPEAVKHTRKVIHLPVSLPKCMIGFKETARSLTGKEHLHRETVMKLMFETLMGASSPLYQKLYDQSLISDSFGFEYNLGAGYAFSVIGGDTPDPDALIDELKRAIDEAIAAGLEPEAFERARRKKIGGYLRMLNSPEAIAGEFTRYRFRDSDLFDILGCYERTTIEEANTCLKEHFNWNRSSISIVEKAGE